MRGIAKVVTGVANGDLKRKLVLEAKGEIAELADTINGMIDTLATFADQVTTVAREVGFEGKLGGQAEVPGAAGLWRDLTDSVNQLAAQLTSQIRAIGEVATAVTKGDLSRTIEVGAQGEVGLLTENVNEMIRNLRDTTTKNREQDWLKTNLARFTGMLQGQKDIKTVAKLIMSELAPLVNAQAGVFYLNEPLDDAPLLRYTAGYAAPRRRGTLQFASGEGLVGQCVVEKERILVSNVPADYLQVTSGSGHAQPLNVVVLPVLFEGDIKAVIELASFEAFSDNHLLFLDQLTRVDRHRAQHDRRQHAHGRTAQAVAVAHDRTADRSRTSSSRPTRSSKRKRACSRSRTKRSRSARARSKKRAARSSRRPSSSRSPRSTSRSSSPTCRTSCARRSTRC